MKTLKWFVICLMIVGIASMAAYANPDGANITKPGGTVSAEANDPIIWVYPTDTEPTGTVPGDLDSADRINIQWAVDNVAEGGIVLLKQYKKDTTTLTPFQLPVPPTAPSLDFYTNLRIHVLRDVNIQGEYEERQMFEQDKDGYDIEDAPLPKPMGVNKGTTITGGHSAFVVGHVLDEEEGEQIEPVSFTIKDIRFFQNHVYGLKILALEGNSEISNCSFVGLKWGYAYAAGEEGAWPIIAGAFNYPPYTPNSHPTDISGNFNILNNYMGVPDYSVPVEPPIPIPVEYFNGIGMILVSLDANVKVDGNYILGNWQGLNIAFNKGLSTVTNNTIIKDGPFILEGFPMTLGFWPLVVPETYNGGFVAKSNTIISRNSLIPNTHGIFLCDYDESQLIGLPDPLPSGITNVIENNEVTMEDGGIAALSCTGASRNSTFKNNVVNGQYDAGTLITKYTTSYYDLGNPFPNPFPVGPSNCEFVGNKITGTADYGFRLTDGCESNAMLGNNLSHLGGNADIYPPTADHALYYLDEGSCNNKIKGYTGGKNSLVYDENREQGNPCNDISGVK